MNNKYYFENSEVREFLVSANSSTDSFMHIYVKFKNKSIPAKKITVHDPKLKRLWSQAEVCFFQVGRYYRSLANVLLLNYVVHNILHADATCVNTSPITDLTRLITKLFNNEEIP